MYLGRRPCGRRLSRSRKVLELMQKYEISARLTFSNSLIRQEHLTDRRCNALCALFEDSLKKQSGVIVHSDLLLEYLKINYPELYFVSSTTKVLTDFSIIYGRGEQRRVSLCRTGFSPQ